MENGQRTKAKGFFPFGYAQGQKTKWEGEAGRQSKDKANIRSPFGDDNQKDRGTAYTRVQILVVGVWGGKMG
jgi:hypothetical protein